MLFWIIAGAVVALIVAGAALLGGSKQLTNRRADEGSYEAQLRRMSGDGGTNGPQGWVS